MSRIELAVARLDSLSQSAKNYWFTFIVWKISPFANAIKCIFLKIYSHNHTYCVSWKRVMLENERARAHIHNQIWWILSLICEHIKDLRSTYRTPVSQRNTHWRNAINNELHTNELKRHCGDGDGDDILKYQIQSIIAPSRLISNSKLRPISIFHHNLLIIYVRAWIGVRTFNLFG